jgi:triosephosphate isomerase (TIM)
MAKRVPVIAGNWKMNTDVESGLKLVKDILDLSKDFSGVDKIVCPPFISITSVAQALSGSSIQVGAQNVSANPDGAFTGEVSTSMLRGFISYAIVGHSERRAMNGETSAMVAEKAIAAANAGINPIVCVGEDLEVRKAGNAERYVAKQLEESLAGYTDWDSLIVAYEPVWAIGTGEAATSEQAQQMTHACREVIRKLAPEAADSVRVLYGGSVNSGNVVELMDQPDIDGALVGGASLKADEFSKLIAAASAS